MPFPRGQLFDTTRIALSDADGRVVPTQVRALDSWSDGSVRWAFLDARLDGDPGATTYWLNYDGAGDEPAAVSGPRLSVVRRDGTIVVDTGVMQCTIDPAGPFPFARVTDADGVSVTDPARTGLRVVTGDGHPYTLTIDDIDIDEAGPVRASLRWRGRLTGGPTSRRLEADVHADLFAGLPTVRMRLTIRNPHPARHPGNFWELGDAGSVLLREATLVIGLPAVETADVRCSVNPGQPLLACGDSLSVYQESSGGTAWNAPTHRNRSGHVPMQVRGYRFVTGEGEQTGLRALPVVSVTRGRRQVAAVLPGFWQSFPRSIVWRDGELELGLWPRQFPDVHELQGGEQKTHEIVLAFGSDDVCEIPLDWGRTPALLRAQPDWYCASGAVTHLEPESDGEGTAYRALVRAAIEGDDTFAAKRERIDEFGWRHFGDLYADHEARFHKGASPLVSHYNNQYDAILGFAIQYLRSGDVRWWSLMTDLAAHVVDIDLYRTAGDKTAYSGGPFWHTAHFVDAGTSTHRSYPRAPGVTGGGPSCEHNHTGGLLLHYFLTGRRESADAVRQLADWVVQIDDGSQTVFRFLDRGHTGLASATRDPAYHGPGRGAAYSIAALLDAHRLTQEPAYLDKAEQLIRRCIHPRDDVDARRLLDAEERWSYTIFLLVLARYLDDSVERGALGRMYAWARESLLLYARWMAVNERPYLDRPDRLEYPDETWAAADMRKSDALLLASLHTRDADERALMRDRAAFFFSSSTRMLLERPTRTLTRPVVILLSAGFRSAWFDRHGTIDDARPEPAAPEDFGEPAVFVPQRTRAERRVKLIAAILMVAVGAAFAALCR